MDYTNLVSELDSDQLKAVDGGRNLLEYVAYLAGYLVSSATDMSPEAAEAWQNSLP